MKKFFTNLFIRLLAIFSPQKVQKPRRRLSAESKKKMAAAQKARWAAKKAAEAQVEVKPE